MHWFKRYGIWLLLAIMLIALAEWRRPAPSPPSLTVTPAESFGDLHGAELIAFADERDGNSDIYTAPASCLTSLSSCSSQTVRLTDSPASDWDAVWSPDGQWLAFTSDRDIDQEIYLIRPDGSGLRNLTRDPAADMSADWSPDGTRLAFISNRSNTHLDVYMMELQSGAVTRLTDMGADVEEPAWLPDGQHIAFVSRRGDRNDIFIVDVACAATAAGDKEKLAGCTSLGPRLTSGPMRLLEVAWSPSMRSLLSSSW